MGYQLNLGVWNSVFAVPSVLVDQHLKLAGAAQLKVILWILRYAGKEFSVSDIAQALSMHEADVRDSMQYWTETGVVCLNDNLLTPGTAAENTVLDTEEETIPVPAEVPAVPMPQPQEPSGKKRVLSRPEKPDTKYLGKRMKEDEGVAFLMRSADEIFGRMTSNNDKATLLLIHEHDGLPVEVLIMLMQYAVGIGKGNMRYIEKMAISWADDEITTLDAAEKRIKQLLSGRDAAKRIQRIFGMDDHSPTEKESEMANLWINTWQFSDEMLRAAYEACVNTKGKYILKYIASILTNWYQAGIHEVSQIKQLTSVKKQSKAKKDYEGTYDIEDYESTSVLDEEWDD